MRPRRDEPLGHEDYLHRVDRLDRAYTESIKEYDRLVTWASGGALALSVTFTDRLSAHPQAASIWWIGAGWIVLGLALLSSLWSQYFSSRLHSSRWDELDHLQMPIEKRPEDWRDEAIRFDRRARLNAKITKWLTVSSGLLLFGGLMLLARFAYLNMSASVAPKDAPYEALKIPPVPEKKGLGDLPEPVRRPPPQTPDKTEKR